MTRPSPDAATPTAAGWSDFATWSIRQPLPAILLFMLLSVAGLIGFHALPVEDMPDIDLPTVRITLTQSGAAPEQLETEVARKVEDAIASLDQLKHIRTAITDGAVQITVEFELEKNLSDALIETRNAVDGVRSDLPSDLLAPSVSAVTVGSEAILTYAVSAPDRNEEALSWYVDDRVTKALLAIPGVGSVVRFGGVDREIRVDVDPLKLAALGISAGDVSRAIRNTQQQSSGGRMTINGEIQSLRMVATQDVASALAALPLVLTSGRQVRLDEVAVVHDDVAEPTQAARLNGVPAVGFRLYAARGADETRIAHVVHETLDRLAGPDGSQFTLVASRVAHTEEQFAGSMHMLYEGALLAVLVVWAFLRDWRATLVAASALPLSILPTFAAMSWLGYSLNTLTLLALAAVIGILVDDAIVEIENIERHARSGKSPLTAAIDAVREIALAVIATTLTLVVVFGPTAMMSGIPGLFFTQFGWTAVIAVLSSLLVARLLTPMMAAHFLRADDEPLTLPVSDGLLMRGYLQVVDWTLRHRRLTVALTVVIFIASAALIGLLRTGLIPPADRGYTTLDFELPPGSSLAMTLEQGEALRRAVAPVAGISQVLVTAGAAQSAVGAGAKAGELRNGSITLTLLPREDRPSQRAIESALRDAVATVPGARVSVGGGLGAKLMLILASDDPAVLSHSAQALVRELRGVGSLSNIRSTADVARPELTVRPDPVRAAELGVSAATIGDAVRIATVGDYDAQLARLNLDDRQVYIRVRVSDGARDQLATLAGLRVPTRSGALVPLSAVASIRWTDGPASIDRYDRQRYVTVSAELNGMALGAALSDARALPAIRQLPSSVALITTGDAEIMDELISGFSLAIVLGVLCVYAVLALLFNSFILPVTILSAIPLSVGGAFLALYLSHGELDVPAMIGLVMLMGIVTKNSILLVEYAVVGMRDAGLSLDVSIRDACHKRARPIIMTSIAMIAGMLPIALGLGADASFRQPMAIAVIGGLVTSTALSLVVVPVMFVSIERWMARLRPTPVAARSATIQEQSWPV